MTLNMIDKMVEDSFTGGNNSNFQPLDYGLLLKTIDDKSQQLNIIIRFVLEFDLWRFDSRFDSLLIDSKLKVFVAEILRKN